MTSFGRTVLLLGLGPAMLAVQPDSGPVVGPLAARVAERIAREWSVPPTALHLRWGRSALPSATPPEALFRVLGKGTDGWFAVVFDARAGAEATAVRVRAGVDDTVMVAVRPLTARTKLLAGDLRPEVRVHWGPPAAGRGEAPGPGWETRRPLASGDVVAWPAVVAPPCIVAGEPVRVSWARGDVTVSMSGIALNSARKGETVRVRVTGRAERLTATVTAPGCAVLIKGGDR